MGEIRDLLPWWVVWGNDLVFGLSWLAACGLGIWLATKVALAPIRSANPDHWTEKARLLLPPRAALRYAGAVLPLLVVIFGVSSDSLSPVPRPLLAAVLAGFVLLLAVRTYRMVMQLGGKSGGGVRSMLSSLAIYLIGLYPHLPLAGVALVVGLVAGWRSQVAIALSVLALLTVVMLRGGNVALLRWLGFLQNASPRVVGVVSQAAERMEVAAPPIDELRWDVANAFAFVQTRRIAVTSRAAEILTDPELESVMVHELGHLAESAWARWQRLLVAMCQWTGIALMAPAIHFAGIAGVPGCLVVLLLGCRWGQSLGRRMEIAADKFANGRLSDSACYARALEKLHAENLVPAVLFARHAYPDLYDRMVDAGVTPEWPRPTPPSRKRLLAAIFCCVFPVLFLAYGGMILSDELNSRQESESTQYAAMLVSFDPGYHLDCLARIRVSEGRDGDAVRLLQVATELDRDDFMAPADLVDVLARLGRCKEAAAAGSKARERYTRALDSLEIDLRGAEGDGFLKSLEKAILSCDERLGRLAEPVDPRRQHRRGHRCRRKFEGPMAVLSVSRSVPGSSVCDGSVGSAGQEPNGSGWPCDPAEINGAITGQSWPESPQFGTPRRKGRGGENLGQVLPLFS